jgi:hypothetical protein
MYQKGQRVVVRAGDNERVMLVEDIIATDDGQQLKLKDPITGLTQMVNPVEDNIVEQLED